MRHWIIVGGVDKGGIIVRTGLEVSSEKEDERLAYGSMVQELELVGERLHYKLLVGEGPGEGWISSRLASKDLAVPANPAWVTQPGGMPEGASGDVQPKMTFYAISDVHVELAPNMEWLRCLPKFQQATVIVAGDLGVNMEQIREALALFKDRFDHVFYCYGNHETWVHKGKSSDMFENSWVKLRAIKVVCDELGILTSPALVEGVWVVPVLGWYHTSWDTEPPLAAPPGKKLAREPPPGEKIATDTFACKWGGYTNGSDALAEKLDEENEAWGCWPLPPDLMKNLQLPRGQRDQPVISFSHFLPHLELMPEKRFLFQPTLTQVVGSTFVQSRIAQLQPDLHVFGHSHFPWDMTLGDEVRYRSWPLGTPDEQARRIASYPTEHTEQWHPLPVFDSEGRHYSGDEACWFSLMYTRIKRDPASFHMASYVKMAFCPEAPEVPGTIISPGGLIEAERPEDQARRDKYVQKSSNSMGRQVAMSSGKAPARAAPGR